MSRAREAARAAGGSGSGEDVVRLQPLEYIHVLDSSTNVTRIVDGPTTYTRSDSESVVGGVQRRIVVPPRHYVVIENPVQRRPDGAVILERPNGQAKVRQGAREIRFAPIEPFALYPGEALEGPPQPLRVLPPFTGVRRRAVNDYDDAGVARVAGDEWIVEGPCTLLPSVDAVDVCDVKATVVPPGVSVKLRALHAFTSADGAARAAGDEWLVEGPCALMPRVEEEVVERVPAVTLTDTTALHLEAKFGFVDIQGVKRDAGEQWLVTKAVTASYTPSPHESVLRREPLTQVTSRQYAVILNPMDTTARPKPRLRLGAREVRRGPTHFFLHPGEQLDGGIRSVYVLGREEALLLTTNETFRDDDGVEHAAGDRWMIRGPREYVPAVCVTVVESRAVILLDDNEGIYVRDTTTGAVRTVVGESYLLQPTEELWEKRVPIRVAALIDAARAGTRTAAGGGRLKGRDASSDTVAFTRVVTYNVPHACVSQVYDYKRKESRIVFGPEQVRLEPDEQFTLLVLSGGKPKVAGKIQTLHMFLGPDYMTDRIAVETADHARLELQLSYTWYFDVAPGDMARGGAMFSVPDFVGDACRAVSSRVRGAAANETFDSFHRNASVIIRCAVFGQVAPGEPRSRLTFDANHLVLTNVDVQSVEPVDQKTRDSLQKSVQLAIEITTKTQEALARHTAESREQKARGEREQQAIEDKAATERMRKGLLELQAVNASIEATGTATAAARGRAEAETIEGETDVQDAELRAASDRIVASQELELVRKGHELDLEQRDLLAKVDAERSAKLADIEISKFRTQVSAIGRDTIAAIAAAGPELQERLLKALNLQGFVLTDGSTPVNLFNAAAHLPGGGAAPPE